MKDFAWLFYIAAGFLVLWYLGDGPKHNGGLATLINGTSSATASDVRNREETLEEKKAAEDAAARSELETGIWVASRKAAKLQRDINEYAEEQSRSKYYDHVFITSVATYETNSDREYVRVHSESGNPYGSVSVSNWRLVSSATSSASILSNATLAPGQDLIVTSGSYVPPERGAYDFDKGALRIYLGSYRKLWYPGATLTLYDREGKVIHRIRL